MALKQNAEELTKIGILKEGTGCQGILADNIYISDEFRCTGERRFHRHELLLPISSRQKQQPRLRTTAAAAKSPSPHRTQTQRHNIVFTGRKGLCRNRHTQLLGLQQTRLPFGQRGAVPAVLPDDERR